MSKTISGKVIGITEIPFELRPEWLMMHRSDAYVEVHIPDAEEEGPDELSEWLMKNYPGIEKETFYIEIDY